MYSIRWIYPIIYELKSDTQYSFVPIKHTPYNTGDDYFYYSHIREVIDNKKFSTDPISFENKDKFTSHVTYNISFFISALAGFITNKTEHAYFANYFIFPALNFLSIFFLINLLIIKKLPSILLSIIILFYPFPAKYMFLPWEFLNDTFSLFLSTIYSNINALDVNQIQRTPNILFTNIHLFLFAGMLYKLLNNKTNLIYLTFLSIIAGISSLVSIQNFLIIYSILILLLMQKQFFKKIIWVSIFSIIISSPGILLIYQSLFNFDTNILTNQINYSTSESFATDQNFIFLDYSKQLFKMLIPISLLAIFKFSNKRIILSSLLSILLLYSLLSFLFGTFSSSKILYRGSDLLFSSLSLSGLFLSFYQIIKSRKVHLIIFKKISIRKKITENFFNSIYNQKNKLKLLVKIFPLLVFSLLFINQFKIYKLNIYEFSDPYFKELYDWTIINTNNDEVAITLDADLLTNLPAFSPLNMYLPQAILSPTSHEERYKRFYETVKFYGFNSNEFESFVRKILYNNKDLKNQKDYYGLNMALIDLVLFYGRFSHRERTDSEIETMTNSFNNILNNNTNLSFRSDYLILSVFDEELVKKESNVYKIIKNSKIIFKNNKYKVYKI